MKKFFGLSSSSKKKAVPADKPSKRGSTGASTASSVSESTRASKSLQGMEISTAMSANDKPAVPQPKRVKMSDPNLPLVMEYMRCMNAHDLKGMATVCTKDISFDFIDAAFTWDAWEGEVGNLFKAFPDFRFEWDDIIYGENDAMIMQEFQASGTHTGCPFGFGPYPEIEPTGIKIKNDPEVLHFYFQDGKISKILFVTKGRLTGPPGVYTQLGGFALQ